MSGQLSDAPSRASIGFFNVRASFFFYFPSEKSSYIIIQSGQQRKRQTRTTLTMTGKDFDVMMEHLQLTRVF